MEEFCLLLNDDEIVAAEAPGVQIDQPEVQAPTVAIHTSPVELAQQARSAARSSRHLARSSPTSSVPKPILLDPYQPVDTSSSRLLSQGHKEVIHKFRRDLSGIGIELPPMESMSEAFDQMQMVKDQGKFTLPCTLGHLELDNALVDSGASINLISLSMAEKLGIAGALQRPTTSIMFGDATSKELQALFDEPLGRALKEGEDVASKARPGDKRKEPAQAPSFKTSQLTMTLFPTKFENGKIAYKIRYKRRSRPFSRAKALVTSEQSRDPTKLKELLSQVLTITLDGGTSSTNA
ncbi:unnamed protein product [Microthlaspi erraticum]|uniref:Aspartic peptidase DDI1-type domain-containing protein n=1 Tax=Microthlaspi erraticum TaxID=1685480 RepID=A0A6D2J3H3_9BRAS|nr:unnamed protein product [Microthlaspi erraticum]